MKLITKRFLGKASLVAMIGAFGSALFGDGTAGGTLLGASETDGLAMDFVAATPDLLVRDSTTILNYSGDPDGLLTMTRASNGYYYNSAGLLTLAGTDGERYDYNPATLAARGLLMEQQMTNRLLRSAEFDNAVWVKSNVTVTANDAVGPFGTTTADLLTATAANGTVIQDLGTVGSAAKSSAIHIKRKTGTGNIDLTLDGGSTWTTVAVDATWTRFVKTQTLADEDFGIRIVASGDEIWVEAADVQTGAFVTSHIPTTSASVTRSADQVTLDDSLFPISTSTGTLVVEAMRPNTLAGPTFCAINGAAFDQDYHRIHSPDGNDIFYSAEVGNVAQADITIANVLVANTTIKIAAAYALNSFQIAVNGTLGTEDTSATPTTDLSVGLVIGARTGVTGVINGWIRKLTYLPRRVTDVELQTRTT